MHEPEQNFFGNAVKGVHPDDSAARAGVTAHRRLHRSKPEIHATTGRNITATAASAGKLLGSIWRPNAAATSSPSDGGVGGPLRVIRRLLGGGIAHITWCSAAMLPTALESAASRACGPASIP